MPCFLLKVRPTKRGQNKTNITTGGWIHASNLFIKRRSFSVVVYGEETQQSFLLRCQNKKGVKRFPAPKNIDLPHLAVS